MGRRREQHQKPSPHVANIGRLLKILGMSQLDFARASGINLAYMNQLLSGRKTNPTLDALAKIASGFGLSVAVLVDQRLDEADLRRELSQAALRLALKRGVSEHPKFVRYIDTDQAPLTVADWERLGHVLVIAEGPSRRRRATAARNRVARPD